MKFSISNLKETIVSFMRAVGYQFEREHGATGEISFVKRIIAGNYPRFHVYAKFLDEIDSWEMNLHLDQKQPSYEGSAAHGGEYSGALVESEASRIQKATHPPDERDKKEEFTNHETMLGI